MRSLAHFIPMRLIGALMIAAAFCLGAVTTSAQVPWSPPCPQTKIINKTNCRATLFMQTTTGTYGPVLVGANVSMGVNTPAPITFLTLQSQAGTWVPIVSPGPVIPFPGPGGPSSGWIDNITLAPMGCCFDVYWHAPTCTIWLFPGIAPPTCIP